MTDSIKSLSALILIACAFILAAGCTGSDSGDAANLTLESIDTLEKNGDISLGEAISLTNSGADIPDWSEHSGGDTAAPVGWTYGAAESNRDWIILNAESAVTQYESALKTLASSGRIFLMMSEEEYKTRVAELEFKYRWAQIYVENYAAADAFENIWFQDYQSFLKGIKLQIEYFEDFGEELKRLLVIGSTFDRKNVPEKNFEMIATIRYDIEDTKLKNDRYLSFLYQYK